LRRARFTYSFAARFWKPVKRPIFDAKGRLIHRLHHVRNVTVEYHQAPKLRGRNSRRKLETFGASNPFKL